MSVEGLFFSETFEDARNDRMSLGIRPGDRVLAITSAGCTPLAMLLDDPSRVVCVDINPCQTHVFRLKIEALRVLDHPDLLRFLGIRRLGRDPLPKDLTPSPAEAAFRAEVYRSLADRLPDDTREFWNSHGKAIARGIQDVGRLSGYFEKFGGTLRHYVYGDRMLFRFFEIDDLAVQERFYHDHFNSRLVDLLEWLVFPFFTSPWALRRLLPGAFTENLERENLGSYLRARARFTLCRVPIKDNYFMSRIFLGCYLSSDDGVPAYLRPENLPVIRERLDRLEIVTGSIDEVLRTVPEASFDRFQLSNVFEWMNGEPLAEAFRQVHRAGRPGARMFFRNFMARRDVPPSVRDRFAFDAEASTQARDRERALLYDDFYVWSRTEGSQAAASA